MKFFNGLLDILAPGWVGSLIGLAGIVAASITYLLTRQRAILAYRTLGERLLGHAEAKLPDDVTVQFRGRPIPRLTRSLVVVWNAGEKTIDGTGIVVTDPLRLEVSEDAEMLSANIIKCSRPVTQMTVSTSTEKPHTAALNFDFLDPGDGAVIELLHSGEKRYPTILGTVRGMPRGPQDMGRVISRRLMSRALPLRINPRVFALIVVVLGLGIALFGLVYPFTETRVSADIPVSRRILLLILGAPYAVLGLLLLWMLRRRYPKSLQTDDIE